jgi:hypothetical protein
VQPVQVFHGERMAGRQAPHLVAFGVVEQPERGQRGGQLGSPGAGQRTELTEGELAVALAEDERLTAGDQELAGPASQQGGQRRVPDRPPAGRQRQVVIEVVQQDQVGFCGPGGEAGRRDLAFDDVDDAPGLEPAGPRRDLGR